jgi:hypothetical protein
MSRCVSRQANKSSPDAHSACPLPGGGGRIRAAVRGEIAQEMAVRLRPITQDRRVGLRAPATGGYFAFPGTGFRELVWRLEWAFR